MKDIILRRELLGFLVGFGYTAFIYEMLPLNELNDMALFALGVIFVLFVAFPTIRKYGV